MVRLVILGFVAGLVGVVVFHQGAAWLMHHLSGTMPEVRFVFGHTPPAYRMVPVPPLGVPALYSAAFWGGLWGILLALVLRSGPLPALLTGLLFGAVVLTLTGFTLVATLKGLPRFAGGDRQVWAWAGLCNGSWGWGTALLLQGLLPRR